MADKTALDALNDALSSNGVPTPDVEVEETPVAGAEDGEDETPTGDEDADTDTDTDSDEETDVDEEGDDTDSDADEDSDEETDTDEEGDDAETPEAKAAREKAEKTEERGTGDILEDPIPKTLGPRGQERMRTLISTVKELQPDADMGRELMGHIRNSNMSADEFNMALTFGKLKHSDSVDDHRKAYKILWDGLKELAPLIGESLPGVDPLEGHADLQARVIAKTLDAKDAAELAAGRNRRKADSVAQQRAQQNVQTNAQRDQQNRQAEASVKKELNDLGAQLLKQDGAMFEAKMRSMTPAQKEKIRSAPAGLRVNAFLKTYLALKAPAKAAAPAQKVPGRQPMRAGKVPAAGGNGVRREAKSAVEAMDFALGLK